MRAISSRSRLLAHIDPATVASAGGVILSGGVKAASANGITLNASDGFRVTYQGVTRSIPKAVLDAMPSGDLAWLRGVIGFAPWQDGIAIDVRYNGSTREYVARFDSASVTPGFYDTLSMHQDGSAWTQPVPDNPSLSAYFDVSNVAQGTEAQALDYIRYIVNKRNGVVAAARRWSIPVYFVDENTPTQDITGNIYGTASQDRFNNLPTPTGAAPDPAGDGHYCAVMIRSDNGTGHGEEYDGYSLTESAGTFSGPGWACIDSVRRGYIRGASGGVNAGLGCRANNTSLLGGLIWPHEIAMGRIEHALAFSHPKQRAFYYSQGDNSFSPANGSVSTPTNPPAGYDTRAGYPGTLTYSITNDPEGLAGGQRVILDPSIDLDAAAVTYGWPSYQLTIAKAAQEYGMIMVDGGGYSAENFGLYLVNTQGYTTNPFASLHTDLDGDDVPAMRWADDLQNNFQLIDMGTQRARSYGNPYSVPTDGSNATAYTA